jgi:hypothetical protein
MALLIEAGQMTASDYVQTYPNLLLASDGASTEAIRAVSVTDQMASFFGQASNCRFRRTRSFPRQTVAVWQSALSRGFWCLLLLKAVMPRQLFSGLPQDFSQMSYSLAWQRMR